MRYILGLDIGTSGVKAVLFSEKGEAVRTANAEYPLYSPKAGWSEQEPEDWARGVAAAAREVCAGVSEIAAVGLSGQMHGMVALDGGFNVVRRAILWNDQRTARECEEITAAAGGLSGLLEMTNNMMLTGYTGGKILWMKEHEPDSFARTRLILNPKDYIRYLLTGVAATEVSDASGTGLFNVEKREWAYPLIDKLGIPRSFFPPCFESCDAIGEVSAQAAAKTGIPEGTPVFGGGGDAVISTVGAGLSAPGRVGVTIGTSGVVAMELPGFAKNPGGKLQTFCSNTPGGYMSFGCTLCAAGSYAWLKSTAAAGETYMTLDAEAREVPAGSDGLIFLPYMTGERCPVFDPEARGGFFGLTAQMGRGHLARAVMEGVCYSLKQVYDIIGVPSEEIVVSGGGAVSPVWRQITADIFGLPAVTLTGAAHGGALGAALVSGVGAGVWESLPAAMSVLKEETRTEPDAQNAQVYARRFASYKKLYDAIKWYNSEI